MIGNSKVLMNVLHNSLEVLIFWTKCHLSTAVLLYHMVHSEFVNKREGTLMRHAE